MKVVQILFALLCIILLSNIASAISYKYDVESKVDTQQNMTIDLGDHYVKLGIFRDNFNDNNITGYTITNNPTYSVTNGELVITDTDDGAGNFYRNIGTYTNFDLYGKITWYISASSNVLFTGKLGYSEAQLGIIDAWGSESGAKVSIFNGATQDVEGTIASSGSYNLHISRDTNNNTKSYFNDVLHREAIYSTASSSITLYTNKWTGYIFPTVKYDNIYLITNNSGNTYFNTIFIADDNITHIGINGSAYGTTDLYVNTSCDNVTWSGETLLQSNITFEELYQINTSKYCKIHIYSTTTNKKYTPIIKNILIESEKQLPLITSSSPSAPTTSYVNESKTFNAGSDQLGNWTWFIDSILMKDTETNTANGTYTNLTAPNGTYNVTAVITNANGSAQTSWNWTTLLNYITTNVTYFDRDNISINLIFNVSYVSPGTQQWGYNYSATDAGNIYNWTYENGTVIQSLTATTLNETLEFMESPALPTGIYHISEALGTSTLTILANSWGMFNNWTGSITFTGIAVNESNDICYTYYNVTNGLWESYYVGYSWNGNYQLSKDASVIGYFDAQTNITSNIIIPSSTELYTGWNMLGIQNSSNQTISGIIADIGANCSDSWYFNLSIGSYSNTTTHSIQPNQGFLAYTTQNMTWIRSAM